MQTPAVLYWIHLESHTNPLLEGYIGVSKRYDRRIVDHFTKLIAKTHSNPHLAYAVGKYGWDNIIKEIILTGDETYCYELEDKMRASKNIGWNISAGGQRGPGWPKGRKRSPESIKNQQKTNAVRKIRTQEKHAFLKSEQKKVRDNIKSIKEQEKLTLKEERKSARIALLLSKEQENLQLTEEAQKIKAKLVKDKLELVLHRPLCQSCTRNLSAVNYRRNGITHYRTRCSSCIRKNRKLAPQKPSWMLTGYKKKPQCEKCGFKAKYKEQLRVYHTDGKLKNNTPINLRTICANCQITIVKEGLGWTQGDLTPDF